MSCLIHWMVEIIKDNSCTWLGSTDVSSLFFQFVNCKGGAWILSSRIFPSGQHGDGCLLTC